MNDHSGLNAGAPNLRRVRWAVRLGATAGAVGLAALVLAPTTALAATSTETVNGGALGFVTPPADFVFPAVTLAGLDQTTPFAEAMDVGDNTGSAAGWNITMTSTTFTGTGLTPPVLANTATSVLAAPPAAVCDIGVACTAATNTAGAYPYTVPAATVAPAATIVLDAAAGSGMGDQTITPTFTLAIPASTRADTYTSTWTIAVVSGP